MKNNFSSVVICVLLIFTGCTIDGVPFDSLNQPDLAEQEGIASADHDFSGEEPLHDGCVPKQGDKNRIILSGTIITGSKKFTNGQVFFRKDTKKIVCVADNCEGAEGAASATLICTGGIIMPGLIDAHNHVHYNILPRWKTTKHYKNRYEWQGDVAYHDFKKPFNALKNDYMCEMTKYGEVIALLGGTTSIQGSYGDRECFRTLIRNIEVSSYGNGLGEDNIETQVGKIDEISSSKLEKVKNGLKDGSIEAFLPHLAEGIDETSRQEFDKLENMGLHQSGTAIIHGTALTEAEFDKMALIGSKIIWSPKSNFTLYGKTTDIAVAISKKVPVSIAPDWTPSGGLNILDELKCVDAWNASHGNFLTDEEMFRMVTAVPAEALHLQDKIGHLEEGFYADIAVFRGNRDRPYRSLVKANSADVIAVFLGGEPLFGKEEILKEIHSPYCEVINVCGENRIICVKTSESPTDKFNQTFADIEGILKSALNTARKKDPAYNPQNPEATYNYEIQPVAFCGNTDTEICGK